MARSTVDREAIACAYRACGVGQGDIVLTHSSLKSMGYVEGGAEAVIGAAQDVVGPEGTVVFPTLVQRDFDNAYKNWNKHSTPSDVGMITEVFRRMPESLRSDQATHSVAAQGKRAIELTQGHGVYGQRMGIFGSTCFAYASPWQKMYFLAAKVVFIGVTTNYNTFKHFVEYRFVERTLACIKDEKLRCNAMAELSSYENPERKYPNGVWPLHDAFRTEAALDSAGLLRYSQCGDARLTCLRADQYVDFVLNLFETDPFTWFDERFCEWYAKYLR
jgi:aminoglycoside 3-N-acetyltransferase